MPEIRPEDNRDVAATSTIGETHQPHAEELSADASAPEVPDEVIHGLLKGMERAIAKLPQIQAATTPKSSDSTQETQGPFCVSDDGVWHVNQLGETERICDRLDVVAKVRMKVGGKNENWSRLLRFRDEDGCPHEVVVPNSALDRRFLKSLEDKGLNIADPKFVLDYLRQSNPQARGFIVTQSGWVDDDFVLPNTSYGTADSLRVWQGHPDRSPAISQAGTLKDWQERVGVPCIGNSRLAFAASAAFVAPLLRLVNEEGGGFHFVGDSSIGKSTTLFVAASIWGRGGEKGYIKSWNTTANGLEDLAEAHNDVLLALDELGKMDPSQAGTTAYTLANGVGKTISKRAQTWQPTATWRLLFLSTGEEKLSELAERGGHQIKAGQEIRMADIHAYAGMGMGVFESLHGSPDADNFARKVKESTQTVFGSAIDAYLTWLVDNREDAVRFITEERDRFKAERLPAGAAGQVSRVLGRFALVAAAGELATKLGILPWDKGEATRAAEICFEAWYEGWMDADTEEMDAIVERVRRFIQTQGHRFVPQESASTVPNLAGYIRDQHGERQFLILPEVFRFEVSAGEDYQRVARVLKERGFWVQGENGRLTCKARLSSSARPHTYGVKASIVNDQ
ncbi:hypothetical protein D3C86_1130640 [compost metagenome]